MTVAMALAEKLHHSSRGKRRARAGEEDLELHYTAKFRTHPPPQAAGVQHFFLDDDEPPAAGSRPDRLCPRSLSKKGAVLREPLPVEHSYSGTRQVRTWRRLVPRRCAVRGELLVGGWLIPCSVAPHAGQPRAVCKYWEGLRLGRGGRPCDHAAPVPAVLRRVRGGASDSVLRQSAGFSCFT